MLSRCTKPQRPAARSPAVRWTQTVRSVITSVARTPIGKFGGVYRPVSAIDLGAAAIRGVLREPALDPAAVDEVLFGHVIQAGQGQITARQAGVMAGIPMTVPSVTINKVCLSGMSAIALADRSIRLGESSFAVAGGMESMTNAPYLDPDVRWGSRMGDVKLVDAMLHDGLWCSLDHCTMGESSDRKNQVLGVGRSEQDEWSVLSHQRAQSATDDGTFAKEIVPVDVTPPRGDAYKVEVDEGIRPDASADSLAGLKPAFVEGGTITAGNAAQISDGAAAVVVADRRAAEAIGLPILAEIVAYGQVGGADATLHERPAEAIRVALKKADMEPSDLELVEINEAFAAVAVWSARMLDLAHDQVNVHGGAVALGHPLGATGARIVVTLINALAKRGGGRGAAALCGGGGQGDAMIIEVPG